VTTLLHISASPRGHQSESLALARSFLDGVRASRAEVETAYWDLWDGTLPEFGPDFAHAKMAVFAGHEFAGRQAAAWTAVQRTFARFNAAEEYLFSVPMWNAGVPYILKQLIDVISQPELVFGFDPEKGYTGLLRGKRAAVIYTSAVYGVDRPPAFGSDFQSTFVEDWLRWAGITDITTVEFRPNLAVDDAVCRRVEAHRRAAKIGRAYGQSGLAATDRENVA
jgi:FMN-dependent NADH-azoreductase